MAKISHHESKLQIQCVTWFKTQYPHLAPLMFAVPNGGSRDKREAAIMKAEGITAGVSDLILNVPAIRYSQLAVEMKDEKGKQSEAQKRYQRYAEAAGVKYIICRSFDDFKEQVSDYLAHANPFVIQNIKDVYREEQEQQVEKARQEYQKRCNTVSTK